MSADTSNRPHPQCWRGDHYEHQCQVPSDRICMEQGCDEPAGTLWGTYWCPDHDVERIARIGAQLKALARGAT